MIKWEDLTDEEQEPYLELVSEMTEDLLYCDREWSAWSYGTMSSHNFSNANEDDDWVAEKAEEIYYFSHKLLKGRELKLERILKND